MSSNIAIVQDDLFCLLPNMPLWTSPSQRVPAEKIRKLSTDDTTTTTLSDHLLRSILIAEHRAASVNGHQVVKVLDGRYAALSGWLLARFS